MRDFQIDDLPKAKNAEVLPGISDRARAAVGDGFVMISLSILAMQIFSALDYSGSGEVQKWVAVFIFGLYDPIFTSLFGATLGHMMMGIRVKRIYNRTRNISFPMAIVRFLLKFLLGWLSLITVSRRTNRQAIHDLTVQSIVVFKPERKES